MTEQTRAHLKLEFADGERPSGADFADLIDSHPNLKDDGLTIDSTHQTLVLSHGIRLGPSTDVQAGTLRLNGSTPEFHDGTNFVPLGSGSGGGAFLPVNGGPDVAFTDNGTVGIGNFGTNPATYRFEVELAANTGTDQQVRIGTSVIHRGTGSQLASAHFSHEDHANNNQFAVRQRSTGEVNVNAPAGSPIFFSQGGNNASAPMTIAPNGHVFVRTPIALTTEALVVLHVSGNAFKSEGGGAWKNGSDARVKSEVEDYGAGLEEVKRIRPVKFKYNGKGGTTNGSRSVGVIGQEIETVLPETVTRSSGKLDGEEVDDLRIFDASALPFALINAVKELARRIEALETERSGGGTS